MKWWLTLFLVLFVGIIGFAFIGELFLGNTEYGLTLGIVIAVLCAVSYKKRKDEKYSQTSNIPKPTAAEQERAKKIFIKWMMGFVIFCVLWAGFVFTFMDFDSSVSYTSTNKSLGDTFEFTCSNGSHRVPYAVDILPGDSINDLKTYGKKRCAEESDMWNKTKGTNGRYNFSTNQF